MALCAISGLGGSDTVLTAFRDSYQSILQEVREEAPILDWQKGLGRPHAYASLLAYFSQEVRVGGIEKTIATYLPRVISAIALDAFHPIIRLGYAIEFQSDSEVAAALAYLVMAYQEMPLDRQMVVDIRELMRCQTKEDEIQFSTRRFSANIIELRDGGNYPTGRAQSLADCAMLALDVYRSTRNFFALHMVTVTHGIRLCQPMVETDLALASLTSGLLAAHKVVGSPGFNQHKPLPVSAQLDREHALKYAWTCLSEYRHYGDERYASELLSLREAGLIPSWCAASEIY